MFALWTYGRMFKFTYFLFGNFQHTFESKNAEKQNTFGVGRGFGIVMHPCHTVHDNMVNTICTIIVINLMVHHERQSHASVISKLKYS
ncbi:hypothetical protein MT325_m604R [Paramecium bursaria chlorella virus MT325]|uniref:Uncharacterized protein m604R n=1 Tax=Paramecium bursaria Chlorella virus MT325 TaxID=346932 RepID=A7IUY4_PBCVM|nr:hypothetical protein MT325_m604R [Paramecium bursaria chlorella virus MT325]